MNEEEKPAETEKKPHIGGIGQQRNQYRTLGGPRPANQSTSTQTPQHPGIQTPERRGTQEPELPNAQTPERRGTQEPELPNAQTRKRHTIYLTPDMSRWLKIHAASTEQEISEVAEKALQHYRQEIER